MRQVMVSVDRAAFDRVVSAMTDEECEALALVHPAWFASIYKFQVPDAEPEVASPAPRPKAPPRTAAGPPFGEVKDHVLLYVQEHTVPGGQGPRSEDIAAKLNLDGKIVKRALTALVNEGKVYVDGSRRGARYTPKLLAAPAGSGPAEDE